jgi:hypothetical protein
MLEPRVVASVDPIVNDEPEVIGTMDIDDASPMGSDEPEVIGNVAIEDASGIDPEVLELARILQSMGRERVQHLVIFCSKTSIHW